MDIDFEGILFREEGSDINIFKKNIDLLDEEKHLEFMKLLVGRYLTSLKEIKILSKLLKFIILKPKR